MLIALLASVLAAQDWEFQSEGGVFVGTESGERKTATELVEHGREVRESGRLKEALRAFRAVRESAPKPSDREAGHFEHAETLHQSGNFLAACDSYQYFNLRYPQSTQAAHMKRMEMSCALELAQGGSKSGVKRVREAFRRYPREEFTPEFVQRLGMVFYNIGDYARAEAEFNAVLDQHGGTAAAVLALYMLGRASDNRFDAIAYDPRPLKDARRHYERFLEEAGRMRGLPGQAPDWVDQVEGTVRERLTVVYDRMLEKRLRTAEYYAWKGRPKAARIYFSSILRDAATFRRVLPDLPETDAIARAREWTGESGAPEAPPPPDESEK